MTQIKLDLYWQHQFEFAGFYAAKQQGFFQEAGIEVEFTELSSHDDYVQRVVDGESQFGLAGVDLVTSFHQGAKVKMLASYFKRSPLVLITQPDITSLKQLEGETIAGPKRLLTRGGIRNMLEFNQVDPFRINTIKTNDSISLFQSKQIAGIISFISNEPYKLNKLKQPYRIFDPNQYGIATMDTNLFTSQQFAKAQPELVKKFTIAANLGWQYALKHPEQIVDLILNKYNTQHKSREELLFEAVETGKFIIPELYDIGLIDRTQLKVISESLLTNKVINKLGNINELLINDQQSEDSAIVIANTTESPNKLKHSELWAQLTIQEQQYLAEHPVLKVQSEANYPPYNFVSHGKPVGYCVDYLMLLEKILNVKFDYVVGFTWAEYLKMLENNTLDLMINIVKTPEREKFANFSLPVANSIESLVVKKDQAVPLTSLEQYRNKKIAVIKKFYQEEILRQAYPEIHLVEVNSVLEGLTMVSNGLVDAFIENLGVNNYFITQYYFANLKTAVISNNPHFQIVNTRIATNKKNLLLHSILNKALPMMPEADILALSRKWFNKINDEKGNDLQLTIQEKNYLQQHPVIKVQNEINFPPFNFMLDGKPAGYSIDFIKLVAKKLGIEAQFVQYKSWNEYLAMLQRNELDAMINIANTDSRQQFARFTTPYIQSSNSVTVRKNEFDANIELSSLAEKRIAVIKGYASSDLIIKLLPNAKFIDFVNIPDALEAVASQKADAFFGMRAVTNYYIDKRFLTNLTQINIAGQHIPQSTPVAIAVNKAKPLLLSVIQKAINSIPEPELIHLRQQWMNSNKESTPVVPLTNQEQLYLTNHQRWRVNMIDDFPPFSFINNGENQGFSIDLMKIIARMLNVQLEFVPGEWSEHLKMLINRRLENNLDVLLNVVNTQDRRKIVRFTQPYIETRDVMVMRTNQVQIDASLSSFNGRTIASIKDYAITNYIKTNFPQIKLLMVNSPKQALLAVSEGRADGHIANEIVANYLIQKNVISNLQIIPVIESETLGKATLSMAVPYNDLMLRGIIDKTLLAIPEQELIGLRKKWFGDFAGTNKTSVVTSKQQKQWLIKHERQTVYLPELGLPLSHKTEQGLQGIIPDFINYFRQQLAVDWEEVAADEADIVITDLRDLKLNDNFIFSDSVSTMPIVAISGDANFAYIDDLNKLNVKLTGVMRDANYQEMITQRYPELVLLQFNDVSAALMALKRGDISLLLCPLALCSYEMNELGLNDLHIINQTEIKDSIHFAVRKDWPELIDIINQVLATMSPQLKNSIYRRWNSREDVLVKTDYTLIWYLLVIAFSIITLVFAWNRRIAKYAHKIELAHDDLKNTQQQLVQAEKMASLGTLTAGVAHEINNPTNFTFASVYLMKQEIESIKQFLIQLAGGEQADPQVLTSFDEKFAKLIELTNTAAEGTQRIKTIVNNLRTFTRLDNDQQKQAVITELINTTVSLVQTQYSQIQIRTQFNAIPELNCYPAKLAQVFMNLIVNACQAIESRQALEKGLQGQVIISSKIVNHQLELCFEDNGCGMDKATQLRIFEPFFTTKDVGSGTGLGMAISFGIIEEHNGMIEIKSSSGQGSTITIYLPMA